MSGHFLPSGELDEPRGDVNLRTTNGEPSPRLPPTRGHLFFTKCKNSRSAQKGSDARRVKSRGARCAMSGKFILSGELDESRGDLSHQTTNCTPQRRGTSATTQMSLFQQNAEEAGWVSRRSLGALPYSVKQRSIPTLKRAANEAPPLRVAVQGFGEKSIPAT